MSREKQTILEEAEAIVNGPRRVSYGNVSETVRRIVRDLEERG